MAQPLDTQDPRPGILGRIERRCDAVFEAVARLCGWVLLVLAFGITIDVVLRELRVMGYIDFNWHFVAEWSTFLVMLVVFAGLAYTLRTDGHITVTLLTHRLPPRVQLALALVTAVICEALLVYMVYRGVLWMNISIARGITSTSVLKTPMWIPNLFVVAGLALFAVAVLLFILRTGASLLRRGEPQGGTH